MSNAAYFIGAPQPFKDICNIYPPKLKDVLGNSEYGMYSKLFLQSQEDIEDDYNENELPMDQLLTPFEFLLVYCFNNKRIEGITLRGFEFFIHEKVTFLYDQSKIIIGNIEEELEYAKEDGIQSFRIIDETNFFEFQNAIRESLGEEPKKPYEKELNPKIARMKALARYRDKVKAKNNKGGVDFSTMLVAICCMGIGITPLNIGEISYCSIKQIMSVYQNKEKYDLDMRSLLAGADSKKIKPKYWIRNPNEN